MCRLFGITRFDFSRHRMLLERFAALADTGMTLAGDTPGHRDGWGIGWHVNGAPAVVKSGGCVKDEMEAFLSACRNASGSGPLIAHLRKSAWPGTTRQEHAHPFAAGGVVFGHNGTIRDYQKLLPQIPPRWAPREGALDTEVFLLHIVSREEPSLERKFRASAGLITAECEFSSLNCTFSDGQQLYGFREYTKEPDYYSLYRAKVGGAEVICSEPLDTAEWDPVSKGALVIAR